MYVPDHFIISVKSCKIVVLKVFIYIGFDISEFGPINFIKHSSPLSADLFPTSNILIIKENMIVMVSI